VLMCKSTDSREFGTDRRMPVGATIFRTALITILAVGGSLFANWDMHVINNVPDPLYAKNPNGLDTADLDADGDLDIVSNYDSGPTYIFWNPGGSNPTAVWPYTELYFLAANEATTVGDVDGDGFPDVVVSAGDEGAGGLATVYIYWGPDPSVDDPTDPASWTKSESIVASQNDGHHLYVTTHDINGDGIEDVVVGGRRQETNWDGPPPIVYDRTRPLTGIKWLEAPADPAARRNVDLWQSHQMMTPKYYGTSGFNFGDFDNDGDDDVVVVDADFNTPAYAERLAWLENPGFTSAEEIEAQRATWPIHELHRGDEFHSKHKIAVTDFNNDGLTDFGVHLPNELYVYLNDDVSIDPMNWRRIVVPKEESAQWAGRSCIEGDVDNDGKVDIIAYTIHDYGTGLSDKLAVFKMSFSGSEPTADNWTTEPIKWKGGFSFGGGRWGGEKWDKALLIDLDNDGDRDLVMNVEEYNAVDPETGILYPYNYNGIELVWFENPLNDSKGTGTGLTAQYFRDTNFYQIDTIRIDPQVHFDWYLGGNMGSTAPAEKADSFSVRWSGQLEAEYSEPYTLYLKYDGAVKLWVDDVLLIDERSTTDGYTETSATMDLTAGQKYDVRIDYVEYAVIAGCFFSWSSPSTPKVYVPTDRLYPTPVPQTIRRLTVNHNGNGATTYGEGVHSFHEGASITLTARDVIGSQFTGWSGNIVGPDRTITFTLNADMTLAADFAMDASCGETDSRWKRMNLGKSQLPSPAAGDDKLQGSACQDGDIIMIQGAGVDIDGYSDQGFFLYDDAYNGDFEVISRIESMGNTDPEAKAGIMVRYDATPFAQFVMLAMRPNGDLNMLYRQRGARVVQSKGWKSVGAGAKWLRVVRIHNNIFGYYSTSGSDGPWTLLEDVQTNVNKRPLYGLAVTSRNEDQLCDAVFSGTIVNPVMYTVEAVTRGEGTISPSGTMQIESNTDQEFSITPAAGMNILDVLVDDLPVGPVSSFTLHNAFQDHSIEALFNTTGYRVALMSAFRDTGFLASNLIDEDYTTRWSAEDYPQFVVVDLGITKSINEVRVHPFENRAYQYTVDVSANKTSGYTTIVDRSTNNVSEQMFVDKFSNVDARYVRLTVTGAFGYIGDTVSINEFEIMDGITNATFLATASAGENGTIDPSGTMVVDAGSNQAYTITPDPGYVIDYVMVNDAYAGAVTEYTFENISSDNIIHAEFTEEPQNGFEELTITVDGKPSCHSYNNACPENPSATRIAFTVYDELPVAYPWIHNEPDFPGFVGVSGTVYTADIDPSSPAFFSNITPIATLDSLDMHNGAETIWITDDVLSYSRYYSCFFADANTGDIISGPHRGRIDREAYNGTIVFSVDAVDWPEGSDIDGRHGVYRFDAATSQVTKVTDLENDLAFLADFTEGSDNPLDWRIDQIQVSPSAAKIAFKLMTDWDGATRTANSPTIVTLDADGSNPKFSGPYRGFFAWYDDESIIGGYNGAHSRFDLDGNLINEDVAGLGSHFAVNASNNNITASQARYGADRPCATIWRMNFFDSYVGARIFENAYGNVSWSGSHRHTNPAFSRDATRFYYIEAISESNVQLRVKNIEGIFDHVDVDPNGTNLIGTYSFDNVVWNSGRASTFLPVYPYTMGFSTDRMEGTASLRSDGVNDYVILNNSGTGYLHDAVRYRTVGFWFKPNESGRIQELYDEGDGSNGFAVRLNEQDHLEACVAGDGGQVVLTSTDPVILDNWHFAAIVYKDGAFTLFLDGKVEETAYTGFGAIGLHSDAAGLCAVHGADAFGFSGDLERKFNGLMDNVKIWEGDYTSGTFDGYRYIKEIDVTYTITASAESGGTISPAGDIIVDEGGSQTFTITADNGYEIDYVLLDGEDIGSVSTFSFDNISADYSIAVYFKSENSPPVGDTVWIKSVTNGMYLREVANILHANSTDSTLTGCMFIREDLGNGDVRLWSTSSACYVECQGSATSFVEVDGAATEATRWLEKANGDYISWEAATQAGKHLRVLDGDAEQKLDCDGDLGVGAQFVYGSYPRLPGPHNPEHFEAEEHDGQEGIKTYADFIGYLENGDWFRFYAMDLGNGYNAIRAFAGRGNRGSASLEVRLDDVNGPVIATITVNNTGAWNQMELTDAAAVSAGTGVRDLYFVVDRAGMNIDYLEFLDPIPPTYTITATAQSGGSITPAGDVMVTEGSSQEFTITPDAGYEIDYVEVEGTNIGAVSTYTFDNVTADASIVAYFKATSSGTEVYEVGQLDVTTDSRDDWDQVTFTNTWTDPVVVVSPVSFNGNDPSVIRVRNVTATGFEVQVEEWEYLDGSHPTENVYYLVMSAGTHTVGGLTWEAGVASNITDSWTTVSFNAVDFTGDQAILAQIVTESEPTTVTTRIRNVLPAGFDIRVQEEENQDGAHNGETVHYIALFEGSGVTDGGAAYEVGTTGDNLTNNWLTLNFSGSYEAPAVFATLSSFDGADPCAVRYRNATGTSMELFAEEEASKDTETNHITETAGYFVIDMTANAGATYTITASAATSGGTISPSGVIEVAEGSGREFTITPDAGYEIDYVEVDGVDIGAVSSYTFENVSTDASIAAYFRVPPSEPAQYEVGRVDVTTESRDDWDQVIFTSSWTDPVVVVSPVSYNDNAPSVVRVRNVTSTGFEIQVDEWEYLDGSHATESVYYLVMPAGTQTIDGLIWQAGVVDNVTDSWTNVSMGGSGFTGGQAVLAQIVTDNESTTATTRIRDVSSLDFDLRVQEEENADGSHAGETVHYIAFFEGSGVTDKGVGFEAGTTGDVLNNVWLTVDFPNTYQTPAVFATLASFDGGDPTAIRYRNATGTSMEL
ncbi:MAG: carbohydrate-binding protein, partial [Chitinivibrionales bacterium]|nr:carbohydrate-binding protein [Chitinivibrionales bacterium]